MSPKEKEQIRHELKFTNNEINYNNIYNWLKFNPLIFKEEYPNRKINNIYFDNFFQKLLNDNIDEKSNRFKIRYRWFDNFNSSNGYLEIKKKFNRYGYKDRFKIKNLHISEKKSWSQILKKIINQIPNNFKVLLKEYNFPIIINQYTRKYFISANNKFRITLDTNIINYDQLLKKKPNLTFHTIDENKLVLEIKFQKKHENEISELLFNLPLRNSKNSKYLNAYNETQII